MEDCRRLKLRLSSIEIIPMSLRPPKYLHSTKVSLEDKGRVHKSLTRIRKTTSVRRCSEKPPDSKLQPLAFPAFFSNRNKNLQRIKSNLRSRRLFFNKNDTVNN